MKSFCAIGHLRADPTILPSLPGTRKRAPESWSGKEGSTMEPPTRPDATSLTHLRPGHRPNFEQGSRPMTPLRAAVFPRPTGSYHTPPNSALDRSRPAAWAHCHSRWPHRPRRPGLDLSAPPESRGSEYGRDGHGAPGAMDPCRCRPGRRHVVGHDGCHDAAERGTHDPRLRDRQPEAGPRRERAVRKHRPFHARLPPGLGCVRRGSHRRAVGLPASGCAGGGDARADATGGSGRARRRRSLATHAAQVRLPGALPKPDRLPARGVATGPPGRPGDGITPRSLLPGLLLGPDGAAVRRRGHESRLGCCDRHVRARGEDGPGGPRRRLALRRCLDRRGGRDARLRALSLPSDLPPALTRVRGLRAIAVELRQGGLHVLACLAIGRNPPIRAHRVLAGVVGGKDERQIVVESVHQATKMADAALDVPSRIEGITHAEGCRRRRHELHQPLGPSGETARGLNWDSISTIAATRFSGTSYRVATSLMWERMSTLRNVRSSAPVMRHAANPEIIVRRSIPRPSTCRPTNERAPAAGDGLTTVGTNVPGASPDDISGQSLGDFPGARWPSRARALVRRW